VSQEPKPDAPRKAEAALRKPLPRWKKVSLGLATLSIVFGFVLAALGSSESEPDRPPVASELGGGQKLLPGTSSGSPAQSTESDAAGDWSPFFIKGGFGFFVGFCIGYALRAFFKISAVAMGVFLLALFGLSYAGVVDVDWATIESYFESFVARLREEGQGFKSFITGSLPSAGLASLGLVAGFRRN